MNTSSDPKMELPVPSESKTMPSAWSKRWNSICASSLG